VPIKTIMICITLGAIVAILSLYSFGLWVAFHPFSPMAERSAWLVPLLQLLSWLPFVALAAFGIVRGLPKFHARAALVAALASVAATLASALYHLPQMSLMNVALAIWLHLLLPVALLPALAALLANNSFKADA
jgi:hypothetical protein